MHYKSEKKRFFDTLLSQNPPVSHKQFPQFAAMEAPAIPEPIRERWGKRYYANPGKLDFTYEPRLANHFCIGADPEYFFELNGEYINASSIDPSISTLRAFGCDITARQAELRAYASPSVLVVVASLLEAMRGMVTQHPTTAAYAWVAKAAMKQDGAGGHIHFGRYKNINADVRALDSLSALITKTTILDKDGNEARQHGRRYGILGDYRKQLHGFEYRTLPTWLDSIWSAFLTLTLAKLCILCHIPTVHVNGSHTVIENLLRRFQHEDDDAKLALKVLLRQGLPVFIGDDFKARWGVPSTLHNPLLERLFFPSSIKPHPSTIKEVWTHLEEGKNIPPRLLIPTWSPYYLSKNVNVLDISLHEAGMPEIASNLISKGPFTVSLGQSRDKDCIFVPPEFRCDKALAKKLGFNIYSSINMNQTRITIKIGPKIQRNFLVDAGRVKHYRDALTSGLLPVAHYTKIDEIDVDRYVGRYYDKRKDIAYRGSVLAIKGEADRPIQAREVRECEIDYELNIGYQDEIDNRLR